MTYLAFSRGRYGSGVRSSFACAVSVSVVRSEASEQHGASQEARSPSLRPRPPRLLPAQTQPGEPPQLNRPHPGPPPLPDPAHHDPQQPPRQPATFDTATHRHLTQHIGAPKTRSHSGSVSIALTSATSPRKPPAGIVGILGFLLEVRRLSKVDVSVMDTGAPSGLSIAPTIGSRPTAHPGIPQGRASQKPKHSNASEERRQDSSLLPVGAR